MPIPNSNLRMRELFRGATLQGSPRLGALQQKQALGVHYEHGSAIANKTGALNQVRNDVALIATKAGPVVIAAFTQDNLDQRWTGDNEAEQTLGKLAKAIVDRWSPSGLDADEFNWDDPGKPAKAANSKP